MRKKQDNKSEEKYQDFLDYQNKIEEEKDKNKIKNDSKIDKSEKYEILSKLKNKYLETLNLNEADKFICNTSSKIAAELLYYVYSNAILTEIYDKKLKLYQNIIKDEDKHIKYYSKNWEVQALIYEYLLIDNPKISRSFMNIPDYGFLDPIFLGFIFTYLEKNYLIESFFDMRKNISISQIYIAIYDLLKSYKIISKEKASNIQNKISDSVNINEANLLAIAYANFDYEYLRILANQQMNIQIFDFYKYINISSLRYVINDLIAEVSLLDEFSINEMNTIQERINNTPITKKIDFKNYPAINQLSDKQKEILILILNNYDRDMICAKLIISKFTLENTHFRDISLILKQTGVIEKGGFNNIKKYIKNFVKK